MRYSELAGKEIIDLSLGVRLGVVSSTDLVIDTEQGLITAMVIYQRVSFFSTRETTLNWCGVKKIGRDLIIVDMDESVAATPAVGESLWGERSYHSEARLGLTPPLPGMQQRSEPAAERRKVRRRVAGITDGNAAVEPKVPEMLPEAEAPEIDFGRPLEPESRRIVPIWRRSGSKGIR